MLHDVTESRFWFFLSQSLKSSKCRLSLLFRAERSNKWASKRLSEGAPLEWAKNWEEGGGEQEGGWGGENRLQSIYRTPFAHEREQKCNLIGQKFDIHALSDIWNTTRSKYILPNPGEALKFSVQETYLDLSQNGKHIHLKSEQ